MHRLLLSTRCLFRLTYNALEISADMVLWDVLKTGYKVKSSVFSEKISALPKNEQERIYDVVDTLIRHAQ